MKRPALLPLTWDDIPPELLKSCQKRGSSNIRRKVRSSCCVSGATQLAGRSNCEAVAAAAGDCRREDALRVCRAAFCRHEEQTHFDGCLLKARDANMFACDRLSTGNWEHFREHRIVRHPDGS